MRKVVTFQKLRRPNELSPVTSTCEEKKLVPSLCRLQRLPLQACNLASIGSCGSCLCVHSASTGSCSFAQPMQA